MTRRHVQGTQSDCRQGRYLEQQAACCLDRRGNLSVHRTCESHLVRRLPCLRCVGVKLGTSHVRDDLLSLRCTDNATQGLRPCSDPVCRWELSVRMPLGTYLRATLHQQIQLPVLECGAATRCVSIYCRNAPNELSARRHMSMSCGVSKQNVHAAL
jgi:hypothetical protein